MADKKGWKINWKAFGIFLVLCGIGGAGIGYVIGLLDIPLESRGPVIGLSLAVVLIPLLYFYFFKHVFVFDSRRKKGK